MSVTEIAPVVLCLGEVLWDCLADEVGRSRQQVSGWTRYPGGAPANVATALAKLGVASGFVGCVGSDRLGSQLVQILTESGVNLEGLQQHPTAPTRQVYVTRTAEGDRQFAGFDRPNRQFADTYLEPDPLPASLFAQARYLVLGTLGLAYSPTKAAVARAIAWAQQHSLTVVVDLNWRPTFWPDPNAAKAAILPLLNCADLVKLTAEEGHWLCHSDDPSEIVRQLQPALGVCVTDGDRGCRYCCEAQRGFVPAFAVPTVDATGAGDGFLAALVAALARSPQDGSRDWQQVVTYASAVGALTVTSAGAMAAQPTALQVSDFLAGELAE
ncbi:carbohydrate kinase [Synechococcus sp. PCC 7336]|uniref:carbohydrate kinase family protein n=1 Tax=Synechococcus sp. PCC 7336 TaxID=195250 RepID=UPI00034D7D02|nr:carbohydrate kinase [Synechococcus sp. PCC 7336]